MPTRAPCAEHVTLAAPLPRWCARGHRGLHRRDEIDAAVLSLGSPGVFFGDQGLANELARSANEQAAAVVRADPSRYAALAFLPLPDLDAALEELTYALDVLGLDGVVLLSQVAGSYLGDPRWDALSTSSSAPRISSSCIRRCPRPPCRWPITRCG